MKTGNPPISNDERITWLVDRADYFEHRDAAGEDMSAQPIGKGFWLLNGDEKSWDCRGLSLLDYIDEMIRRERETAARNALEEFSHDD